MYEPVKFKRLKELVGELYHKLEKLQDGQLHKLDLEQLTEESRELYERLIVLRFKAFQSEVQQTSNEQVIKDSPSTNIPEAEMANVPPIDFRINSPKSDTTTQVSLIDAIAEVARETQQDETISNESTTASVPESTPKSSISEAAPTLNDQMRAKVQENFYDKLSKSIEQKESLNNKLEQAAIADLKRAISLNQRFQFSKELFKGNNQEYEVAIEKLNTTTREDALKQLETLRNKYQWNESSSIANDFVDLVERRYA